MTLLNISGKSVTSRHFSLTVGVINNISRRMQSTAPTSPMCPTNRIDTKKRGDSMSAMSSSSSQLERKGKNRRRVILWHRNDLRVHDNLSLHEALERCENQNDVAELVPTYIFDPRFFSPIGVVEKRKSLTNAPKCSQRRAEFLLESVLDLKAQYKRLGSDLLIKIGTTEDVLEQLNADIIVASREVCEDEQELERKVKRRAELKLVWDNTLYHYGDVFESGECYQNGINDLPTQFTQFRNKVEGKVSVRKPTNDSDLHERLKRASPSNFGEDMMFVPTIEDIPLSDDARQFHNNLPKEFAITPVYTFKGGESEALKRVQRYLFETDAVATYFNTRNGMLEDLESTKLAPFLSLGCISPRFIENEIRKYEKERVKNKSTYWVIFELTWRDYFRFFALRHGTKIFKLDGIGSNVKMPPWTAEHEGRDEIFEKWITGTTGYPLIDANMRELKLTGWMSNRGRQNVASWLALDARIDWRMGAEWFEFLLLDYDPASNWGNWVSAAGLTRGRVNKFNIPKQTKDYDPEMIYCRKFIPELDSKNYPRPLQLKKAVFEERRGGGGARGDRRFKGGGGKEGRGRGSGKKNRQPPITAFYSDHGKSGNVSS